MLSIVHRPKVLPSSPWEVTRVGLPGKNSGIQTMVTKSLEKLFGYNFGKKNLGMNFQDELFGKILRIY